MRAQGAEREAGPGASGRGRRAGPGAGRLARGCARRPGLGVVVPAGPAEGRAGWAGGWLADGAGDEFDGGFVGLALLVGPGDLDLVAGVVLVEQLGQRVRGGDRLAV